MFIVLAYIGITANAVHSAGENNSEIPLEDSDLLILLSLNYTLGDSPLGITWFQHVSDLHIERVTNEDAFRCCPLFSSLYFFLFCSFFFSFL